MANGTNRNILENGRAEFAYKRSKLGVASEGDEYKNFAKKLPMLIKTNGLAAALAFTKHKRKSLFEDVNNWLVVEKKMISLRENQSLIEYLVSSNTLEYRTITIEVLAFLNWVRRFSDGI